MILPQKQAKVCDVKMYAMFSLVKLVRIWYFLAQYAIISDVSSISNHA